MVHVVCGPLKRASLRPGAMRPRIILPQSALDHLARLNISWPMLFEAELGWLLPSFWGRRSAAW